MPGRIAWRAFGSGCSTISVDSHRPGRASQTTRRAGSLRKAPRRLDGVADVLTGALSASTMPVDGVAPIASGSIRENNNSSPPALDELHRLCPKLRDRACRYDVVIGVSQTAQEPPCRLLLSAVRSGA